MIPKSFVEEGLALADGACIFGVRFDSLTRDELIAVAALGWRAEESARKEGARQRTFLMDMNRARRA